MEPMLLPAPVPIIGVPAGEVGAAVSEGSAPERLVVTAPPLSEAQAEKHVTSTPASRRSAADRGLEQQRRSKVLVMVVPHFARPRAVGRGPDKTNPAPSPGAPRSAA